MNQERVVKAAVALTAGGPVEIVDVEVASPGRGEVLIDVEACGLCHSDVHYIHGSSGQDFPYLVGHEVAGRVSGIGEDVSHVQVGDRVIVALMAPCGTCDQCLKGCGVRCADKMVPAGRPRLGTGEELTPVLGVGGLAGRVTINRRHVIAVPDEVPAKIAALMGCGVPTGFGAAVNTAGIKSGDSVAVIGVGSVGLAAIAGASHLGATRIVAIDMLETKLAESRHWGATETHLVGTGDVADGFDVVIDAVGGAGTLKSALELVGVGGRVVVAGAPSMTEVGDIALRMMFLKRNEIVVSHWGDWDPVQNVSILVDLYLAGTLPLDRMVSECTTIDDAAAAYQRLERGEVFRSVVMFG